MNTKLGLIKLSALAVCCAFGFSMTQLAHADGFSIGYRSGGHWDGHDHGRYSVSVGVGSPGYYGGYYAPRRHGYYAPQHYYYAPSYSYYDADPYYSYYDYDDAPSYNSRYYRDYDRSEYEGDDRYPHRDFYDRDDYDDDD